MRNTFKIANQFEKKTPFPGAATDIDRYQYMVLADKPS